MPILTKNETPAKGQKAEFQLDKAALATLPSVAGDTYFSDTANWKRVELFYKSDVGRQIRVVKFDATQATPIGDFFVSSTARDNFEIDYIIINDFDGGEFKVLRSELTVAEFDVSIASQFTGGLTRNFSISAPAEWYEQLNGGAQIVNGKLVFSSVGSTINWQTSPSYILGISVIPSVQYRTIRVYFDRGNMDPDYVPEITVFNEGFSYSQKWGPTPSNIPGLQGQDWANGYFTITNVPINAYNVTENYATKIMLTAADTFGGSVPFRITAIEIFPL